MILLLLAVKAEDAIETSKHPFPFVSVIQAAGLIYRDTF